MIASEGPCVVQAPISRERFDKLISTMTEVRDAAVTETATILAARERRGKGALARRWISVPLHPHPQAIAIA